MVQPDEEAPNVDAVLMVHCASAVAVIVNGSKIGESAAEAFSPFTLMAGEHMVRLASLDGRGHWQGIVRLPPGEQTLLKPQLLPTDPSEGMPATFTDPTDQRKYRTVLLGGLEWFAENYAGDRTNAVNSPISGKFYPASTVRNGLPSGWRLPTRAEYERLLSLYTDPYAELVGGRSGFDLKLTGAYEAGSINQSGQFAALWTSSVGPPRYGRPTMWGLYVRGAQRTISWDNWFSDGDLIRYSVRFVRGLRT